MNEYIYQLSIPISGQGILDLEWVFCARRRIPISGQEIIIFKSSTAVTTLFLVRLIMDNKYYLHADFSASTMRLFSVLCLVPVYASIGNKMTPTPPKFAEEFALQYKIHNSQFGFTVIGK